VRQFIITEIVEEAAFRVAFDRLVRAGPLMEPILRTRIESIKESLIEFNGTPPGYFPHADFDGSYVVTREGIRVRYYMTPALPQNWFSRTIDRLRRTAKLKRVRIRLQRVEWPGYERLAGS
jgi:hypothetical protein